MPQNPDTTRLTREDRENLRLIRSSRQRQAAEVRLKHAMTLVLLDLQTRLSTCAKINGDQ